MTSYPFFTKVTPIILPKLVLLAAGLNLLVVMDLKTLKKKFKLL